MIAAICKEIKLTPLFPGGDEKKEKISTLYFGGGTPSILTSSELSLLFEALHSRFVFAENAEITLEANPDDITDKKLHGWKQLGVNRLSVGIQSFSEPELVWMNRAHTASESLICIDKIRNAGILNFSVDLIYGSPVLSDDDWKKNVDLVIEKNIPHISCYALTVEPNTALDKMIALQKKEPVDADKQSRQFLQLMRWMELAGYEHYEISNFALPGLRSNHNSSYWSGESYYAFGPAAHSFFGNKRKWNVANNSLYIHSLEKGLIPFEEEVLTREQQLNEYIMTSLRTLEGLNLDYVDNRFGKEKSDHLQAAVSKYANSGKLIIKDSRVILTKDGKLFADGIASDLFF